MRRAFDRRALAFSLLLLLLPASACNVSAPRAMNNGDSQVSKPGTAFASVRHPDTVETKRAYLVRVGKLSGPRMAEGRVNYSVSNERGEKTVEGEAALRAAGGQEVWQGEIPGQPSGSTVTYHFVFSAEGGGAVRHPARSPSAYRFRVLPLLARSVTFPPRERRADAGSLLTLSLQSPSQPAGEMVLRVLPASTGTPAEVRLPLTPKRDAARGEDGFELEGRMPELAPGQIASFYFRVRNAEGAQLNVPADAPARVFSFKKPFRSLQPLNGDDAFVLGGGIIDGRHWVGLKGGGVWAESPEGAAVHWGLGDGLPSGVARHVLPDEASGKVYVATDRGVVAIDAKGQSLAPVALPYPSAWGADLPALSRLGSDRRARPAALSPLDGMLLFQLQQEQAFESVFPASELLQLRDERLSEWPLPARLKFPAVGFSTMSFDAVDGCWLLGGLTPAAERSLRPFVLRGCGEQVEEFLLPAFERDGLSFSPERIVGLTQDPSTGRLVVGLEFSLKGQTAKAHGVYLLDSATGGLSPLAPAVARMGAEVTSLATDWRNSRVLIGTLGEGLWEVGGGKAGRVALGGDAPSEVTLVEVEQGSGAVLLGTTRGAFSLSGGEARRVPVGPRGASPRLAEALPMDYQQTTGRILLSSYSAGLFQIGRGDGGKWGVVESLQAGERLPAGLYSDAQYDGANGMSAILLSRGLLRIDERQAKLLTTGEGLSGVHLLRLLARRSGETWVAYLPMPFGDKPSGATLQVVRDDRVAKTFKVESREFATIGRWVDVPERKTIFAATRAGVVEIRDDGSLVRLSTDAVSSITREPRSGTIAAVGTSVQRWDGKRFAPVLFSSSHPRWPRDQFQAGAPTDIAIDRAGFWYLLFEGVVVVLDPQGGFSGLLDAEDGIPPTARRLLAHPETGDVVVGSAGEGLTVITSARNPG